MTKSVRGLRTKSAGIFIAKQWVFVIIYLIFSTELEKDMTRDKYYLRNGKFLVSRVTKISQK